MGREEKDERFQDEEPAMDESQVLSALHTEVRCLDRWRVHFTQLGDRAESWPLSFRKGPTCLHPFRQQVAALACKLFPVGAGGQLASCG